MQIRLQETKVRKQIQITTFATFFLPDFETFGGSLGRSTVAHFARKVRGANIAAAKHELKIQQSHAQKRWSCSLRVCGPHFASKVSYNAGAATDDYASQRKSPLRGRWCLFANLDFYGILNILFISSPVLGLFSNLSSLIMLALLLRISSKIAQKCRYKIAELFLSSLLKRGRPPTG